MKKSETMYAIAVWNYGKKHYSHLIDSMEWDAWMDFVLNDIQTGLRDGRLILVNRLGK